MLGATQPFLVNQGLIVLSLLQLGMGLAYAGVCCGLERETASSSIIELINSETSGALYSPKVLAGTWKRRVNDKKGARLQQKLDFVKDSSDLLVCYVHRIADSGLPDAAEKYESMRMVELRHGEDRPEKATCIILSNASSRLYIKFIDQNTVRVIESPQSSGVGCKSIIGVFVREQAGDRVMALGLEALQGAWYATFNSPDRALGDSNKAYLNYSLYFHKFEDRLAYRGLFKLRASGKGSFDTVLESAYKGEVLERLTLCAKGKVIDRCFLIDVATYARFLDEETLEIFLVDRKTKETSQVSMARNLAFKRYLVGIYKRMMPLTESGL